MPQRLVLYAFVLGGLYVWSGSWLLPAIAGGGSLYLSALLHPYVDCDTCGGQGRHRSLLFPFATRPCHACSGSGSKQRITAQAIGRGRPRRSSSRVAPRTKTFGKS